MKEGINMAKMSRAEFQESLRRDPNNEQGGRNQRNTPQESYNCGGFALSIYDWVTPYSKASYPNENENEYTDDDREALMLELYEANWLIEDIENEIIKRDADYLLHTYPFLNQVNPKNCANDDTLIAYRIFIKWDTENGLVEDTDFHFKVRYHGYWFEKMGSGTISICNLDADKPWSYGEDLIYTSKIIYFTTWRTNL